MQGEIIRFEKWKKYYSLAPTQVGYLQTAIDNLKNILTYEELWG